MRQHSLLQGVVLAIVNPSVWCQPVCLYCVKTTQAIYIHVVFTSLLKVKDSAMTLFFTVNFIANFQRKHMEQGDE